MLGEAEDDPHRWTPGLHGEFWMKLLAPVLIPLSVSLPLYVTLPFKQMYQGGGGGGGKEREGGEDNNDGTQNVVIVFMSHL